MMAGVHKNTELAAVAAAAVGGAAAAAAVAAVGAVAAVAAVAATTIAAITATCVPVPVATSIFLINLRVTHSVMNASPGIRQAV